MASTDELLDYHHVCLLQGADERKVLRSVEGVALLGLKVEVA